MPHHLAISAAVRRAWPAALVALVVGASSCARPKRVAGAPRATESAAPIPTEITLVVDNQSWTDVAVLIAHSGQSTRLGTVTATSRAALRFPSKWVLGSNRLELVARAIGGRESLRSEPFVMQPDQRVEWSLLGHKLTRAALSVY